MNEFLLGHFRFHMSMFVVSFNYLKDLFQEEMHDGQINGHCRNIQNARDKWSGCVRRIEAQLLEKHRHHGARYHADCHRDNERE